MNCKIHNLCYNVWKGDLSRDTKMKIKQEVLKDIYKAMPVIPPEIGGIIGGKNDVVSIWHKDIGVYSRGCMYSPNVRELNLIIEQWGKQEVFFMGIFHVHFWGVDTISEGDIVYIKQIMNAMPEVINKLYFPIIVQPLNKCIPYIAYRGKNNEIIIRQDELIIL